MMIRIMSGISGLLSLLVMVTMRIYNLEHNLRMNTNTSGYVPLGEETSLIFISAHLFHRYVMIYRHDIRTVPNPCSLSNVAYAMIKRLCNYNYYQH